MKILNVHAEEEIGEIGEGDGKRVRERATGQSTSTCMGGGDGRRYRGGRKGVHTSDMQRNRWKFREEKGGIKRSRYMGFSRKARVKGQDDREKGGD